MNKLWKGILYDKDGAAGGGGDKEGDPPKGEKGGEKPPIKTPTFDEWIGGQNDAVKGLIEGHVKGLKTALGSEREARGEAEKDLRKVADKLEKGSEAQKEVLKLADDVAVGNTKVDFYEDAHKAGVSNLKLAYHVATTEDLFDKRGNVDFEKMKENFPELFTKPSHRPKGGAGDGTDTELGRQPSMNEYIRRSAGRST